MLSTRYKTHVANAYHKTVWVNMGCDQSAMKSANFMIGDKNVKAGGGVEFELETVDKTGFTRVTPKDVVEFTPDVGFFAFFGKTIYVTACADGESEFIADAFPIQCDTSVIITAEGGITTAKYGKLWVDFRGKQHMP